MNTTTPIPHPQFYTLSVKAHHLSADRNIVNSNSERARVIATLQDALLGRVPEDSCRAVQEIQHHVDLLAFSITRTEATLLVCSLSARAVRNLGALIINNLIDFQRELNTLSRKVSLCTSNRPLAGEYDALDVSLDLHANHLDWEYDRYSSIGFYLHERRGAWMHIWRLSRLYDNRPDHYRALMEHKVRQLERTTRRRVPSLRA